MKNTEPFFPELQAFNWTGYYWIFTKITGKLPEWNTRDFYQQHGKSLSELNADKLLPTTWYLHVEWALPTFTNTVEILYQNWMPVNFYEQHGKAVFESTETEHLPTTG